MKNPHSVKSRLFLLTKVALTLLLASGSSYAANVALNANDALGQSSYTTGAHWIGGAAPSAANDYFTGGFMLRTPPDGTNGFNHIFAGASLTLEAPTLAGAGNGSLLEKFGGGAPNGRTLTINNLTNAAGAIVRSGDANGVIVHIAGNHYTIAGTSSIWADQNIWIIDSPLLGGDSVILTNDTRNAANHIAYSGNNSGFSGSWVILGVPNGYTELLAANSQPANPSVFNPAQIMIQANGILLDTAGTTFSNPNGGFTLAGVNTAINVPGATTIAEPITGGFALTKTGGGVLTLSGANTYTGGTVISAGTLKIGVANTLPVGNVTDNAVLDLNSISTTIDGLSGLGVVDTLTGGTPILTVGANGGGGTFTGFIQNSLGTLSLTKIGAGTITLSSGYSHSGTTLVGGGTLSVATTLALPGAPGSVIVSNATLALDASIGTPLPVSNLVLGTNGTASLTLNSAANGINGSGNLTLQDNATINCIYGSLSGNPTALAINVAGSISAPGTNIVINISALGLVPGPAFPLIKYTGTALPNVANFVLNTPPGVVATLVNNTANTSIDVLITSAPRSLTWYGAGGTNWDFVTINWKNGLTDTLYQQFTNGSVIAGDGVRFDDTLTNDFVNPQPLTINLTSTFFPFPVTVDSTLPYSFNGVGGINGPTSLVKSNAGSLTLSTSNAYTGGTFIYGGSVVIVNDSALGSSNGLVTLGGGTLQINANLTNNVRTFSVPVASTIGVGSNAAVRIGGPIAGAGGFTKTDNGTLTIGGTNGVTGPVNVSQGTLNIQGTNTLPGVVTIGNTPGLNAQFNIAGGTLNARNNGGQFASSLIIGAAGGAGDLRLTSGTLSVQQQFGLGAGAGGYAGFTMSGGTLGSGSYIVVGFNNDLAVYNQSAGLTIVSNNVMTIAAGGAAAIGVANFTGGNYFATNGVTGNNTTRGGLFVGENGNGTLNVSGSATVTAIGQANLTLGRTGAGSAGTVNLLGGTIVTPQVARGAGSATFNFNGGTLRSSAANVSYMSGLSSATIYNVGAIIDDGGFAITIPQSLQAAAGFGVSSIPVLTGGSGYINTPIVTISGGSGSNATATATVAGGAVTAVTVTCPGTGYLNTDVLSVTFTGGGATPTPPTVGTITFAANGTGGLSKRGSGTLTLTGVNTFAGPITNVAGTLSLNSTSTYAGPVVISAGTVTMTTLPKLTGNATIANNATLSITQVGSGTSSVSNLTFNGAAAIPGATLGLGIGAANNPAVPFVNAGTLTLNGTNTVSLAGAVKVGTTPLVKYVGPITGSGTLTNLVLPQGATGFISNDVANSTLYVVVTSTGPGLVWTGTNANPALTNLWDINSTVNWLINTTPTTYRQSIVPGDAVTFSDTGSGTVILNTTVGPASLIVSNNTRNYTLRGTGLVSGPTGIQKLGTGTAILQLTNNSYLGDTIVSNGTLQAGTTTALSPSANLVVGPSGTFEMAGFSQTIGSLTGSGVVNNNSGVQIGLTVGSAGGGTWNGTIKDVGAGGITLTKVGNNTWFVGGSNYLNNGDAFTIQAQFNAGTTIITNAGLINIPHMEMWIAQNGGSTSTVVVAGGTLAVSNNWLVVGRNANSADGTLIVNSGRVIKAGNNNFVVGSLGAQGTLIVNGGEVINNSQLWLGENAGANGILRLNGGLVQATQVRPNGATPNSSIIYFNGGTLQARASSTDFILSTPLVQSGGAFLDDGGFVLHIATQGFQEDPLSTGGGLVKKGAGTVYLDGFNTMPGTTTVSNGTLAGIGGVAGPVVVASAGNIGAGNEIGVGTFSLTATPLTLGGHATMRINKTGGFPTSDLIAGVSTLNYGGTLVISNISTDPLIPGDAFTLFSATTPVGNFGSIIATSPGPGLGYSFEPTTGVLSVIGVADNPTNITFSVIGSTLSMGWPEDHRGWILQSQTNSTSVGLSSNWIDISGSGSVTNMSFTIDPANPTVFYRLRHP
jgi:autotransporter-associated beta strand protein